MLALIAIIFIILTGISMLVFLSGIAIYNRLARLRSAVKSLWSDIDVQLRKRYELVPSLVEAVKCYAVHEKSVFEGVSRAMFSAMKASAPSDKHKAEGMFNETLKSLFAVTEECPELKANADFRQLQSQIEELRENIVAASRYFNSVVSDYNIMTETFPSNIIASLFRFEKEESFGSAIP